MVFQERPDFAVCAAQMENEGFLLALEDKAKVETAAAFHERRDAA